MYVSMCILHVYVLECVYVMKVEVTGGVFQCIPVGGRNSEEDHVDKPVSAYSNGNRRKLSTAITLLARPPVVFLVKLLIVTFLGHVLYNCMLVG